jgi:hypothetical protein
MPETVFETVVAASPDRPCPMRRTSVGSTKQGRDRTLIYADTPVKVPVKYHPDARFYRRRLREGDLKKFAPESLLDKPKASKATKSTPAAAPTKKE